jgi:hypothetical protein
MATTAESLEINRLRPGLKDRQGSGLTAADRQVSGLTAADRQISGLIIVKQLSGLERQASGLTAADIHIQPSAADKQPAVLKPQSSNLKRAKSKFLSDRIVREATETTEAAERKAKQNELLSTRDNSNLSQKMLDDLERKKGMIDEMRMKRGRNKDDPVVYVIELGGDNTIIATYVV